jgi:hypothetical protein
VRVAQVHLCIDGRFSRESDVHFAGHKPHCPLEASRPTGGEQLLGVSSGAGGAGDRKFNVQAAIVAARSAGPAARRVGYGSVLHSSFI